MHLNEFGCTIDDLENIEFDLDAENLIFDT